LVRKESKKMTYSEFGKKVAKYLIKNGEIDIVEDCIINIVGTDNTDCNTGCWDCWKNELNKIIDGEDKKNEKQD
jgi:hypothetical protein